MDEDLWEELIGKPTREWGKTHTGLVMVQGSKTLPHPLSCYSVYIDGYISKTRSEDTQPENGELVRLIPGEHRIIVRESEVKKVNRLESNTLWFTAVEGVLLRFEVGMPDGLLKLVQR